MQEEPVVRPVGVKVKNGIRVGRETVLLAAAQDTRWIKPAQSRNRIPPRLWFLESPNAFKFQTSSADETGIFLVLKMILRPGLFLSLEPEI